MVVEGEPPLEKMTGPIPREAVDVVARGGERGGRFIVEVRQPSYLPNVGERPFWALEADARIGKDDA